MKSGKSLRLLYTTLNLLTTDLLCNVSLFIPHNVFCVSQDVFGTIMRRHITVNQTNQGFQADGLGIFSIQRYPLSFHTHFPFGRLETVRFRAASAKLRNKIPIVYFARQLAQMIIQRRLPVAVPRHEHDAVCVRVKKTVTESVHQFVQFQSGVCRGERTNKHVNVATLTNILFVGFMLDESHVV